uniref:Uncharacterized protein n=1 Tax=Bicosoecida sp. CB-2014 TaxID=1486930 RepID=A0A7S1G946_9STRA
MVVAAPPEPTVPELLAELDALEWRHASELAAASARHEAKVAAALDAPSPAQAAEIEQLRERLRASERDRAKLAVNAAAAESKAARLARRLAEVAGEVGDRAGASADEAEVRSLRRQLEELTRRCGEAEGTLAAMQAAQAANERVRSAHSRERQQWVDVLAAENEQLRRLLEGARTMKAEMVTDLNELAAERAALINRRAGAAHMALMDGTVPSPSTRTGGSDDGAASSETPRSSPPPPPPPPPPAR